MDLRLSPPFNRLLFSSYQILWLHLSQAFNVKHTHTHSNDPNVSVHDITIATTCARIANQKYSKKMQRFFGMRNLVYTRRLSALSGVHVTQSYSIRNSWNIFAAAAAYHIAHMFGSHLEYRWMVARTTAGKCEMRRTLNEWLCCGWLASGNAIEIFCFFIWMWMGLSIEFFFTGPWFGPGTQKT